MDQRAEGHVRAPRERLAHGKVSIVTGATLIRTTLGDDRGIAAGGPAELTQAREALRAGIGLRAIHHKEVLARGPAIGWFEAHSENYFARGGSPRDVLAGVRQNYPLSLH